MFFDKRIIYGLMAVMLIYGLMSYLTDANALLILLYTIPGVLIAITFHEFAHAWMADRLGDDTPRMEGRLSLNPLAHLDPVGSIMLLFAGFGWGKPVNVNPTNYNRDISMEKADALVSIAGPVMNFILAIVLTIIYSLIMKFASEIVFTNGILTIILQMISIAITINVGLGVFNLIPLPPLDGSKVIKPILPYKAKEWFENNETMCYIIFVGLWIFGILGRIISPIIEVVNTSIINLIFTIFGLN